MINFALTLGELFINSTMKNNYILLLALCTLPLLSQAQQKTYVPDDNFETWYELMGYGDGILNDSIWTSAIDTVKIVGFGGTYDATGIEDFTALEEVFGFGSLTHLDLSHNLNLKRIHSDNTVLQSLNINNCTQLEYLLCRNNNLSNLDLSDNINLKTLICEENNLSNLDLSTNINLESLSAYSNPLIALNLSANINLTYIGLAWNHQLTHLDITNNINLEEFYAPDCSNLVVVDARNGNNSNFTTFSVVDNPQLECVNVDDSIYSNNTSGWYYNGTTYFSENCPTVDTIEPIVPQEDKTLIKIVDVLGRETKAVRNTLLFYIYKDGSVEKKLIVN